MKKRTDGRYQVSIMIGFQDNGKPKRKVIYGKTQKEVNEKVNEVRMQHSMGVKIDNNITLQEWCTTWLKTYKSGVEYNTLRQYKSIIKNYIIPYLGHLKLSDIKIVHLQKIVNDNIDKPRTIELYKKIIKQILNKALDNDLIMKNPANAIALPNKVKNTNKRALTQQEIEKIKDLELEPMTKCFIYLALYTGMRRAEILALSKNDIDLHKKKITVCKTIIFLDNKNAEGKTTEIKSPKTKASIREIPIISPLESILTNYINSINTDFLFTQNNGELISSGNYKGMYKQFKKAMGTNDITAHIFRHNFATTLYNAGVDIKTAQSILGHSSITITMDIYTHLKDENKNQALDKLNDYLK